MRQEIVNGLWPFSFLIKNKMIGYWAESKLYLWLSHKLMYPNTYGWEHIIKLNSVIWVVKDYFEQEKKKKKHFLLSVLALIKKINIGFTRLLSTD